MSLYDAIIVQNLTYRSIDVSYNLLQGLFVTSIPALSMVIIDGVRLENLTDSVRQVLIPKGYLKVKQYLSTTKIPKPAYWIESGLPSRCLSVTAFAGTLDWHSASGTDYTLTSTITGHATLSDHLIHGYVFHDALHGTHALSAVFHCAYAIHKTVTGHAVLSANFIYTPASSSGIGYDAIGSTLQVY